MDKHILRYQRSFPKEAFEHLPHHLVNTYKRQMYYNFLQDIINFIGDEKASKLLNLEQVVDPNNMLFVTMKLDAKKLIHHKEIFELAEKLYKENQLLLSNVDPILRVHLSEEASHEYENFKAKNLDG